MISTDDAAFADRLRLMRAHGLARESARFDAYAAENPNVDPRFLFVATGLNFRSTELNAFLGIPQLDKLDARVGHPQPQHEPLPRGRARLAAQRLPHRGHELLRAAADRPRRGGRAPRRAPSPTRLEIESRPVVAGNLMSASVHAEAATVRVHGTTAAYAPGMLPHAEAIDAFGLYLGNGHHVSEAQVDAAHRRPPRRLTSGRRTPPV